MSSSSPGPDAEPVLVGDVFFYRRRASADAFATLDRCRRGVASALADRLREPGALRAGEVAVFVPRTVPPPERAYGRQDDVGAYYHWRRTPAFHADSARHRVHRDAFEAQRCAMVEAARTALRHAGLDESVDLSRSGAVPGCWVASVDWRGRRVAVGSGATMETALQSVPTHVPSVAFALAPLDADAPG